MSLQYGKLVKKIYTSDNGHFHVFALRLHGGDYGVAIFRGDNPPKPLRTVTYCLQGKWTTHARYGQLFQIDSYTRDKTAPSRNPEAAVLVDALKHVG